MKKNINILILIFIIIILVISILGLSYGFYVGVINKNLSDKSFSLESKYLSVVYSDGTSQMNFDGDYIFSGDSAEKSFSVENTGNDVSVYSILIDNVVNEFERIQDLRYTLYINDEEIGTGAINNNEVQYLLYDREIPQGQIDNVKFVFVYSETEEIQNVDLGKNISFRFNIDAKKKNSITSEDNNVIFVSNESTLNNYRIYGNSVQNDDLSEAQSVGDKTINLINIYEDRIAILGKIQNDGYKVEDGVISFQTSYFDTANNIYGIKFKVEPNTDYRFKYTNLAGRSANYFYDLNGNQVYYSNGGNEGGNFTFNSGDNEYLVWNMLSNGWNLYVEMTDVMLIKDGDSTEYEPYGKYKIPVTVSGKNLFNRDLLTQDYTYTQRYGDYGIKQIKTTATNAGFRFPIDIKKGENFIVSFKLIDYQNDSARVYVRFRNVDLTNVQSNSFGIKESVDMYSATFTAVDDLKYIEFYTQSVWEDGSYFTIDNIMISKMTDTNFEPYKGEPMTTNIYLDEPLRMIDGYIDFKEQMVIKNESQDSYPVKLPTINLFEGTNLITVDTSTIPSKIYFED